MRIIKKILFIYSLCLIIISLSFSFYIYHNIKDLNIPYITSYKEEIYTSVYDNKNNLIESLNEDKRDNITYEELPAHLINALISIEDNEFFYHRGIDFKRLLTSLINNLFSSSLQGGSTLSQQLIKNKILDNSKTLLRKIQEGYLSILLEKNFTKEEILTLYFNEVYFEPTIQGISYAAKRYFSKEVNNLSINEAALLVGLVKSPSYYNPLKNIEAANKRKNLVLKRMKEENYINDIQYNNAIKVHVADLINEYKYPLKTYKYQAYLDVVYKEVERLTSLNPYTIPLRIETYLDTSLQQYIDEIQEGKIIDFIDDLIDVGGVVLNNDETKIIGILGKRNYRGVNLFSHAIDLKLQVASTIKPIFTYALGFEYLKCHNYTPLQDTPYQYKNSKIEVLNADKKYLGEIPLIDALGYSRNTATMHLLEKIIDKISLEKVIEYLKAIKMMDEGEFNLSYALGGYTYGVNLISLAGGYALLANRGNYLEPSTIKNIYLLPSNELIYSRNLEYQKVLSDEGAYLTANCLIDIVNKNYLNIAYCKPKDIVIGAKTGTNAYDKGLIKRKNYPQYADKDTYLCGFSKHYTLAIWGGFIKALDDQKTYFAKNDQKRLIPKQIFKNIIERLELKNQKLEIVDNLQEVNIVRNLDKLYYPNELIPQEYIVKVLIRKEDLDIPYLPYPKLNPIKNVDIFYCLNNLYINIEDQLIKDDIYEKIFGKKVYLISLDSEHYHYQNTYETKTIIIDDFNLESFNLIIYETFINNQKILSIPYNYIYFKT